MARYQAILGDPVSGQDVTAYLEWDTWTIEATYGQRGRTAKFFLSEDIALNPLAWAITVLPETRITVLDTVLNQILFAGVVCDPRLMRAREDGPMLNRWELNCKDYSFYADNRFVQGDYSNQTLDFILRDLTSRSGVNITTAHVNVGPTIARCVINYLSLTEAWNRACQYGSQGAIWGWFVDDNLDLHAFNGLTQTARTSPSFSDNLGAPGATSPVVDNVNVFAITYDNFYYEWDGTSVRNRIKVRGGYYTGPQTDHFTGNGGTSSFPMTLPVNTGQANLSVTVAGGNVPASIDNGSNVSAPVPVGTCVVTQVPSGQWFLRFGTTPSNGQAIVCSYTFQMPVLTQVDDIPSQQAYSLQPNSLANPSFESSATGTLPAYPGSGGWCGNNVGTGTAIVDATSPNHGFNDLQLTNPSTGNYGGAFQSQGEPVVAGQQITISAYIKGNFSGTTGPLRITFANSGTHITTSGVANAQPSAQPGVSIMDLSPTITAAYAQYTHTVTVPNGFSWAFIEIYANGNGRASIVSIDDVAFQVASPNGGVFEMYLSDPTITSNITAKARGQREISEYGVAEERVYFQTAESNGFHVAVGDVISCSFGLVPDYTKPLNPIGIVQGQYLISQLHMEGRKGPYRVYGVTAVRVG